MNSRANYQAWCIEASEFKSFSDLVRWAVLAPSSHNTQPWKFEVEVEQGTIVVSPDLSRALKVSDPTYRQLYMSLGAACRNLKIAGRYFGLQHAQEILACPTTRTPSKRVRFSPGDSASPAEVELFHAIPRRCSQRGAHSPRPLPLELRQTLLDDAQRAGLELSLLQDRADLAQPGVMMYAVDRIILSDSGFTGELSEWVRPNFHRRSGWHARRRIQFAGPGVRVVSGDDPQRAHGLTSGRSRPSAVRRADHECPSHRHRP